MNQKIKFLRETLCLTEKEISSFLNISSYKYVSFEKTATDIPCDILILLSKIYGINIEFLLYSKFNDQDLLSDLERQGLIEENNILDRLRQNLLQNNDTKITYRSIRKVKNDFQQNIISFINNLIKNSGMTLMDFARHIDIDKQSLDSILSKKRFIELDELIGISEKFKISVNDIIKWLRRTDFYICLLSIVYILLFSI